MGYYWQTYLAIIMQQTSRVCIPDVVLAQTLWGKRSQWPTNWRLEIIRTATGQLVSKPMQYFKAECTEQCPLHKTAGIRHRHLSVNVQDLEEYLGCLTLFRDKKDEETGVTTFNFKEPIWNGESTEFLEQVKKLVTERRAQGR